MSKEKSSGDARTILIVSDGRPEPLGVTPTAKGFNFAIYATRPQLLSLLVQSNNTPGRASEIQLCKTGDVWHIELTGLPENFAYVYKSVPKYHNIQNPVHILNDPYAKSFLPGMMTDALATPPPLRNSAFYSGSYDWEDDIHPAIPLSETILYELHVKGFTRHSSAQVKTPGTFSGLIEKIPYLKSLGITTVELLPINEFVESLVTRHNPDSGEKLVNFWGYDTLGFFAPKRSYATDNPDQDPATAFKDMIKSFHRAGLEVILDIVFNHTGEGPKNGPVFSFRGLSPNTYYQIENPSRKYRNFSGCGNTVNCNHPIVIKMIMDVLRYWVTEMHVDGFRFDLASILTRGSNGEPLAQPPLIQAINADPVLSSSKLIAEAWDAAGLYQVGQFPGGKRWAEWNDKFRDDLRRFVRGDNGMFPRLATRIAGSSDLFRHDDRSPLNSINFVTCHDGFTMMDLNSYKNKRNRINGENNRDGMGENFSFDYGVEGPTPDAEIIKLRQKQVKNLITLLLLAQGVPMFLAGDEFGRSQNGNNNAYCQDNEISWVNWQLAEKNAALLRFTRMMIHFRKDHPTLRRKRFFEDDPSGTINIRWYDTKLIHPDWSGNGAFLSFHLLPVHGDTDLFVITNAEPKQLTCLLPKPESATKWRLKVNTALASPQDFVDDGREMNLPDQSKFLIDPQSTVILIAR